MSILKWQKIDSRYLVREKWATLRVDTCKLQNDLVKDDYYVLEYPDWANAVAVTRENEILFVRQYRHGADLISLEIPAGVIEEGEDPAVAVQRELLEETGYSFDTCELIASLYPNPATSTNRAFTFLLTGGVKTQEQDLDEHEILELEKYTFDEVRDLLTNQKIAQAMHVAALHYGLIKLSSK